jgi:universal stress protein A
MTYRHILVAVDFSEHAERAVERASDLAKHYSAELSMVHVVEYLPILDPSFGPVVPFDVDLSETMLEAGKKRIAELGERSGIPENHRWVEMGSPKAEIVRIAEEQKADLIVLGSHGRHGVALLLGSTAASVMHHAGCDVLAVRLPG